MPTGCGRRKAVECPLQALSRTYLMNRNDRNGTNSSGAKAQFSHGPNVGAEAPTPVAPVHEMTSSRKEEIKARGENEGRRARGVALRPLRKKETQVPRLTRSGGGEGKGGNHRWVASLLRISCRSSRALGKSGCAAMEDGKAAIVAAARRARGLFAFME